jgi:hypothetical protein
MDDAGQEVPAPGLPALIEIKPDGRGVPRMWIDGELFPYGTVSGYTLGEISRKQLPHVTVSIPAVRITTDHGFPPERNRKQVAVIAGDWQEYTAWCRENDMPPCGGPAFYATPDSLQGRADVTIAVTGAWKDRGDLAAIREQLGHVFRVGPGHPQAVLKEIEDALLFGKDERM